MDATYETVDANGTAVVKNGLSHGECLRECNDGCTGVEYRTDAQGRCEIHTGTSLSSKKCSDSTLCSETGGTYECHMCDMSATEEDPSEVLPWKVRSHETICSSSLSSGSGSFSITRDATDAKFANVATSGGCGDDDGEDMLVRLENDGDETVTYIIDTCDTASTIDTAITIWKEGKDDYVKCNDDHHSGPGTCAHDTGHSWLNYTMEPGESAIIAVTAYCCCMYDSWPKSGPGGTKWKLTLNVKKV